MPELSLQVSNQAFGLLGRSTVSFHRQFDAPDEKARSAEPITQPSARTLRQLTQLREALETIQNQRLRSRSAGGTVEPQAASAVSTTPLNLSLETAARLESSEEINIAPTSFSKFGPTFNGSTVSVPWSGPGSTAEAAVSGSYDGSNGSGTLTFTVNRQGTHGVDDLRIKVYDPNGDFIENINIDKSDPLNKTYTLSNGLEITLGAGDIVKNESFTVDTQLLATTFGPAAPQWSGSTANASIGGTYDGSNGTGELTFKVTREGTHGEDDLRLRVFAPDGSVVEDINIKKNDAIDKVYELTNGLTVSLDAGTLIKNELFTLHVDADDPQATNPSQPEWQVSSAAASIGGTYDGSLGSGTLTFLAQSTGTHGEKDLRLKVYAPDGAFIENVDVAAGDPIDQVYSLSSGLTLTLSAGDLIKNESFTLDVTASASFSTSAHPVESTAEPTIDGVYDGSQGTGAITFQVSQEGTHGIDDLAIDVFAPDQSLIETIQVLASDPIDQVYTLSNGLTLQLDAGTLVLNETFVVDANEQVGSVVDPDKSFNGIRNAKPNFDYNVSVGAGSFDINGVSITVLADDTINSVLNRINQAGIDVSASFDSATETVVLTHNNPGVENGIVLENDTSGFLAATKLAEGVLFTGGSDVTKTIADVIAFDNISSGTISVNGVAISVDVDVDSLEDVIGRINLSAAGVTASFDETNNLFSVAGNAAGDDFTLASGSTNFFSTLGIDDAVYEGVKALSGARAKTGYSKHVRYEIAEAMNSFSDAMNSLFNQRDQSTGNDPYLDDIRQTLHAEIASTFGISGPRFETKFGVNLDFDAGLSEVLHFGKANQRKLIASLGTSRGASDFRDLMFGENRSKTDGLAERLISLAARTERDLGQRLNELGLLVDVFA